MRRQRLRWAAGAPALLALGALVLWPRPDRLTRENFERIKEGMSRAEAEAMLGGPPGYHADGPVGYPNGYLPADLQGFPPGHTSETWLGDSGIVEVVFDPHGRVAWRQWSPSERDPETSRIEWLRWRAEVRWRRWFP
jgi:hypothetical protein